MGRVTARWPWHRWFTTYFGCLKLDQIERVWDYLVLVDSMFASYLALAILMSLRCAPPVLLAWFTDSLIHATIQALRC